MFDSPELAAFRASVAAVDRVYALLRKMALYGWQGMRVRKASRLAEEEEAIVTNLIALLRRLHAFRSEASSQVEALLDKKVDKTKVYVGCYVLERHGDEINIFDESVSICGVVYDSLRDKADLLSVILGKSYSNLLAIMLRPVFESPELQNMSYFSGTAKPDALHRIISGERERLLVLEKITDFLTQYHGTLRSRNRQSRKAHKS